MEAPAKTFTLRSSDGKEFVVAVAVAVQSQVIKFMIDDDCADDAIPLFNVIGTILVKVIEYCSRHADAAASENELRNWDAEFVKLDQAILLELLMAANYLEIKSLLNLTCGRYDDWKLLKRSVRSSTSRTTSLQRRRRKCVEKTNGILNNQCLPG